MLKKIVKIYNFDGPGVLSKEFNSERFNIISKKLVNIIPTGSVIGAFLYNQGYDVVESVSSLFNEHYPNSWCVFKRSAVSCSFIPATGSSRSRILASVAIARAISRRRCSPYGRFPGISN